MTNFRIVFGFLAFAAVGIACFSAPTAPKDPVPLSLSIHYLDGLSARSSQKPQEIRFLHNGCHLSLLLTNTTKDEVYLWKPNCPEGDDAIRLEFKLDADSKTVGVARTSHAYTGGMGIPKTMKLAPGDSLVYQIDFSGFWSLPFMLKPGAHANLLVRAVYESKPMNSVREQLIPNATPNANKVWTGRVETEWEPVRVVNLTDFEAPNGHRAQTCWNSLLPHILAPIAS